VELWQLIVIIGTLLATFIAFLWVAIRLSSVSSGPKSPKDVATASVNTAINQAFTDEFKEELQERARKQFDVLMQENAKFLQQDVRIAASKLDEFIKQEVVNTLRQELAQQTQSIAQTHQMVTNSLTQNKQQFEHSLAQEKERRIKQLDDHMAEIVKSYIMAAIGEVFDPDKQLALVIDNLNAHKAEIYEDIRRGV
jgi:hypothetical protein